MSESIISPVLSKEFRERFRTFRGSLLIFLYVGAVVTITLGFIYLNSRYSGDVFQPEQSKDVFIMLSMLQLFLIAFITPGLSAGVISSERERQTLNILLTTRLSASSIILSKLLSSLAFTILVVGATLPVYATVTLYGGIAAEQLAGVFGLYFVNMVFFGGVGVFLSTWIKKTGISTVIAYGIIFAIVVFTFLVPEMMDQYLRSQAMSETIGGVGTVSFELGPIYQTPVSIWVIRSLNPIIVMLSIFNEMNMMNMPVIPWKIYTGTYAVISIVLILVSIYILPPVKKRRKY